MLSASQIVDRIRVGEVSAVDCLEACIERIDALDGKLRAWVEVDRERARLAARQRYEASKHGAVSGALFGVPIGIKDIFDAGGLPTRAGAAAFAHYTPAADSTAVARLRAAGAIILGKTETTQFAYSDPAPTRNPWDLERTPGGSSSGSAVAVAAGMAPLAIGSQTVGSTLRPAAYCGIVGLKPTHGRISLAGAVPLAWSLDHCGIFSRNLRDAAIALDALAGFDPDDPHSLDASLESCVTAVGAPKTGAVLGLARSFYDSRADAEVRAHLESVASVAERQGARVLEVRMPRAPEAVLEIGMAVMRAEAAAYHRAAFERHEDDFGPRIRRLVEQGLAAQAVDYIAAQQARRAFRREMTALFEEVDAILLPAAPTVAPRGLESTGDPVFCAPASFAGLPAVSLPSGLSAEGMPLAVQLIAAPLAEANLLSVAAWLEAVLDFGAAPPL